jgi:hypothetical protein
LARLPGKKEERQPATPVLPEMVGTDALQETESTISDLLFRHEHLGGALHPPYSTRTLVKILKAIRRMVQMNQ